MAFALNNYILNGFIVLLFVSFIGFAIVIVSQGISEPTMFSKTIQRRPMLEDLKHETSTLNNYSIESLTRKLSCEQQTIHRQKKHECYHLNWHKNNLTHEVISTCGFISIQRQRGRTGNNMFQVAALLGTAYDLDLIPVIKPKFPLTNHYNLPNVMDITLSNVHTCEKESSVRKYTKCTLPHGKKIVNMTMTGFRQSWKYFYNIESVIAKVFTKDFKRNSIWKAKSFINTIANATYTIIGVHIRRTDIQRNRSKSGNYADVRYFEKAMTYFKIFYHEVRFIIMSDDPKWVKQNIKSNELFYSPFSSATDDLALMSLCNHMIVTYGTFGWWGAWLANGTTVFFEEKHTEPSKVLPVMNSDYFIPGSMGIR